MSRFSAGIALGSAQVRCPLNEPRVRLRQTIAALCGLLLTPLVLADEHEHHDHQVEELSPTVITAIAPSSPLTVVTNPRDPRQPVPASDGGDYLKTIPGFALVRNGGTNGDPVLRGMFGSRLNILTNGSMLLGACPGRMDAPTSYISPETYDKLTVIKGPQTVLWGPGASAGTVLFEREPEQFGELGTRVNASVLAGSNGRFDKVVDAAAGGPLGYVRVIGNTAHSDDYRDGNNDTVPSRYDKWNGDVTLGWTPDADTLLELTAGKGDGEARYAGRGMDGSQFKRESLGLRFERSNIGEVLDKIEAQVYYNYADHVMDNYTLRTPSGTGMMAGPMASNVDRRTLGARVKATWRWADVQLISGLDAQTNEHRQRSSMGVDTYKDLPYTKDADFHNYGVFGELTWYAADRDRVITGARLDRASAKDYRQSIGSGMSARPNPHRRRHSRRHTAQRFRPLRTRPGRQPHYPLRRRRSRATLPGLLGAVLGERRPQRLVECLRRDQAGENHPARLRPAVQDRHSRSLGFGLCRTGARLHPVRLHPRNDGYHLPSREHRCADHGR